MHKAHPAATADRCLPNHIKLHFKLLTRALLQDSVPECPHSPDCSLNRSRRGAGSGEQPLAQGGKLFQGRGPRGRLQGIANLLNPPLKVGLLGGSGGNKLGARPLAVA